MADQDTEVLFEGFLLKFRGNDNNRGFRLTVGWKQRYFVLRRVGELPILSYYDKKPVTYRERPRDSIHLKPQLWIEKRRNIRGKEHVCELHTMNRSLLIAASDEKILHLFVFFIQTQCKIREELEESCFVVRPENSDWQRCIGARGSMCFLHVSQWGVTLALQLSKAVLAQWPLRCIKSYESTGRGQFGLEIGGRAPTGPGLFLFNTRYTQDNTIYDLLDKYVMEATQLQMARGDVELPGKEHESLQALTEVRCDSNFTVHLKKVSRDIYDFFWEHTGGDPTRTKTARSASSPDLLSDAPHQTVIRSASDIATATPPLMMKKVKAQPQMVPAVPHHQYANGSPAAGSSGDKDISIHATDSITSQYLHTSHTASPTHSVLSGTTTSLQYHPMSPPPTFYEATRDPGADAAGSVSPSSLLRHPEKVKARLRLRSKSWDDLSDYMRMSVRKSMYQAYTNQVFRLSDEMNIPSQERVSSYSDVTNQAPPIPEEVDAYMPMNGDVTFPRRKGKHKDKRAHIRKSMSNPNMLDTGLGDSWFDKGQETSGKLPFDTIGLPDVHIRAERRSSESAKSGSQSPSKTPSGLLDIKVTDRTVCFKKQKSVDSTPGTPELVAKGTPPLSRQNSSHPMLGRTLPAVPDELEHGTMETLC